MRFRENYGGNPLTLQSFLNKIDLIEITRNQIYKLLLQVLCNQNLREKCVKHYLIEWKEKNDIKIALKNGIKPENFKIIAGKIAALNVRNNDLTEFTKQAEELADFLKRSLVLEGITQNRAHEMAVEQTISVCRLNA